MAKKMKLTDITDMFAGMDVEALEGVTIEGDIELDLGGLGGGFDPMLAAALGQESAVLAQHFARIAGMFGYPVGIGAGAPAPAAALAAPKFKDLIPAKFDVANMADWATPIQEVRIGNTSADGGSRGKAVHVGGEKALPFYFDAEMPNRNQVTIDVFDMRIGLAKAVKQNYDEVMDSPGEWAKKNVEQFNADMITIHLISTDPLIKDTPAKEAAKVVEEVLQAVDVPIAIGGSGNPQKDPEVLAKAAEVAEGERCLLASASLNLDYAAIAEAALKYDHDVLSWTQLDMNSQKELNRKLMKQCNVPRERIIMDPTTAALGYGLDYAYTNMERIRLAALLGDDELTFPMSSGTTNAWGARESWMVGSPLKEDSDWGPREYRGPIWEIVTGLSLALAGNDLFMMMHPTSVAFLKKATQTLFGSIDAEPVDISNWIAAEV
ncbi:CO dehydrogenase/acetyl-CoA synthase subunit delta, corrinoid iron-sulfur subcomplex small subunit [Methanosarcina sp. MTP4]|uniref:CO dehydrogenase/acetyl-CoA synthase subunit delta n=1 Tax=Methanosarcina sp. MTP4 TaxID=1434100 RepID=UPI000615D9C7|nr:CO dehydrogenase/acetyl-CoA synthase subunit delta [Methanosarcina sp. MTP4]AKB24152.1 CO dehydrogenase/acetyl-CoA synthase subunit delta, corrinoid iron-sulfur subcomplex small subunit [Methanosarcina sp. MTP4]